MTNDTPTPTARLMWAYRAGQAARRCGVVFCMYRSHAVRAMWNKGWNNERPD